ncbi:MAG: hypothetical protein Q9M82_02190 [Mariprofundus sp.]|nr:hypothetical protein [Mariprofundus sp.]
MKNYFRALVSTIFLLCVAGTASADSLTFVSLGGGSGGPSKSTNFSFDMGVTVQDSFLLAFSVGVIQNGGDVPNDILRYPVPHTSYTNLGIKQDGSEYAIMGKAGVEVSDTNIYLIGILGASLSTEITLAQSNITGWFYEQNTTNKTNAVYGTGMAYIYPKGLLLEVDYDNRRGITGMIGWSF